VEFILGPAEGWIRGRQGFASRIAAAYFDKFEKGRRSMKRRNVLKIFAVILLGFVVLASNAVAQQKSLKEQLVGAWTLVSFEVTNKDGATQQTFGPNPRGVLILDAGGKYAQMWGRPDRPKLKASENLRRDTPAAELGEAARGFAAGFGTWSVNEADKTLISRWEGALIPNMEDRETKVSVSLAGNELKLSAISRAAEKVELVYKR
jgi:hypothetical protein